MSKWIYQHLRADRARIDMGPYETEEEAEIDRKEHASAGVITFGPYKVPDDYRLYKGSWEEE